MTATAKDRDRAYAQSKNGEFPPPDVDEMEDDPELNDQANGDASGTKVVVIHVGSQNLRLGLACDALPKTVPMVIARKWSYCESEENDGEPRPKRVKLDDGSYPEPEKLFGPDVCSNHAVWRGSF